MNIKEEHLDLTISCPFTGKMLWVRELEAGLYEPFYKAGYEWLFENNTVIEAPVITEEEFFAEDKKGKK
jgi:hypothetical protein